MGTRTNQLKLLPIDCKEIEEEQVGFQVALPKLDPFSAPARYRSSDQLDLFFNVTQIAKALLSLISVATNCLIMFSATSISMRTSDRFTL